MRFFLKCGYCGTSLICLNIMNQVCHHLDLILHYHLFCTIRLKPSVDVGMKKKQDGVVQQRWEVFLVITKQGCFIPRGPNL